MLEIIKEIMGVFKDYGVLELAGAALISGISYIGYRMFKYFSVKGPEVLEGHISLMSTLKVNDTTKTSALAALAVAGAAHELLVKELHKVVTGQHEVDLIGHKTSHGMLTEILAALKEFSAKNPHITSIKPLTETLTSEVSRKGVT